MWTVGVRDGPAALISAPLIKLVEKVSQKHLFRARDALEGTSRDQGSSTTMRVAEAGDGLS